MWLKSERGWRATKVLLMLLVTAAIAYAVGQERGWRYAEAAGFRAGVESSRQEALRRSKEAFQAGYELGRLETVSQRQLTTPGGASTSCIACHAGTPNRPRADQDRRGLQIRLPDRQKRVPAPSLVWWTQDER